MTIRLLPTKIINRIAAGEVVERPASVVKELVENSIDAHSSDIKIVLEQGGRNLIKIIDDGCGIPRQELKLALERHATSKVSGDDILNIAYMGFRGEALPSIAAVSRMTITSRTQYTETGSMIKIEGGEIIQDITPSLSKYGTTIEVRDLFFATPNRLKFLKSEKSETQYIIDIINKIAIAKPKVKFTLIVNDKQLFEYPSCPNYIERLSKIKGREFQENTIEINTKSGDIGIMGYTGVPTYNRANSHHIYLFVNNRPIHSTVLIGAIKAAYQDFIPHGGRYPIVVLFLVLPYYLVDVNVHPSKAEVRFQDKNTVRNFVINELKLAIKKSIYKATSETGKKALDYFAKNHNQKNYLNNEVCESEKKEFLNFIPRKEQHRRDISQSSTEIVEQQNHMNKITIHNNVKEDIDDFQQENLKYLEKAHPLGLASCQLYNTYILSVTDNSIFLVDQHAAHERLVYEYLKNTTKIERQSLLIPEMIEFSSAEVELLISYSDKLQKLGMIIEKMGEVSIVIREIPAIIGNCEVKQLTLDVLDTISAFGEALSLQEKLKHIYGTFACHTSIRAGKKLNISEMNSLLRQMESTEHSGQCNHGRPTYIKLKKSDIEKLFERT